MSFPEIVRSKSVVRNPSIRTFRIWERSHASLAHAGVAEGCKKVVPGVFDQSFSAASEMRLTMRRQPAANKSIFFWLSSVAPTPK